MVVEVETQNNPMTCGAGKLNCGSQEQKADPLLRGVATLGIKPAGESVYGKNYQPESSVYSSYLPHRQRNDPTPVTRWALNQPLMNIGNRCASLAGIWAA